MNIMMAITSNLLEIAQVMLFSLFRNNNTQVDVYLVHHGLDLETINGLGRVADLFLGKKIIPIDVGEIEKDFFQTDATFSIEVWYKFLGLSLLPKNIDKVLWLDADIIIKGSLLELYSIEMGENLIAACEDINANINGMDLAIKSRLGLSTNSVYYNVGVVLFNLNNIRKTDFFSRIQAFLADKSANLQYYEQDMMNIVFGKEICCIPWRLYNMHPGCYVLDMKKAIEGEIKYISYGEMYAESKQEDYNERFVNVTNLMIDNACVIHYVGQSKPWNVAVKDMHWAHIPFRKTWEEYAKELENVLHNKF